MLDLVLLYLVGAIGCAMRLYDFPLVPAVLGLILGPLSEQQFRRAMAIGEGNPLMFLTRPISAVVLLMAAGVLFGPRLLELLARKTRP
jgi:putative tricarboxylic transport membrane protein